MLDPDPDSHQNFTDPIPHHCKRHFFEVVFLFFWAGFFLLQTLYSLHISESIFLLLQRPRIENKSTSFRPAYVYLTQCLGFKISALETAAGSVVDPDPVGSESFCRSRIRD